MRPYDGALPMRRLGGRLARAAVAAQRGVPPPPPAGRPPCAGDFRKWGRPACEPRGGAAALRRLPAAGVHSSCASGAPPGATGAATAAQKAARAQEEALQVEVVTGDVRGGGCVAPASLMFFGEHGARVRPLQPPCRRCFCGLCAPP